MLLNISTNEGIKRNDIYMICEALGRGDIIVNDAEYIEQTSLGMAIKHNCSIELINFLLKNEAQVKTEYKINKSSAGVVIHEYNHLHLAIIYRRVDIVSTFLEHGAKIIVDIPFLEILDKLHQKTKSYGICSFIKDDADCIIYAEIKSCLSGILTTLNIAFGVNDPKIASLILEYNKASFIKDIEDNGIISNYRYINHSDEWEEYYTSHPYYDFYRPDKRLNRKDSIDHIDDLSVKVSYLNHSIVSFLKIELDNRIGLLKPYISTPYRIAYMIMFNTLRSLQPKNTEEEELLKINTLDLITKCIDYYQLKSEDITKAISNLIKDGIINNLQYRIKCCKRFKSDEISNITLSYTEVLFKCGSEISNSIRVHSQENEKLKEKISTALSNINIKGVSIRVDVCIDKLKQTTPTNQYSYHLF